MAHSADESHWRDLEANAHRPEVQEHIRHAIKSRKIRVLPNSNGGIRILPIRQRDLATDPTLTELLRDGTG